ncbi:MAG: hypothetical protein U1E39_18325 [Planctomycetota bacterium]
MSRRMSSTLAAPVARATPTVEPVHQAVPASPEAASAGRLVRRYERLAVGLSRLVERDGEEPLVHDAVRATRAGPGALAGQRARTLADDARRLAEDAAVASPFLVGQVRALEAVAAVLAGERRPFRELVRTVAGVPAVAPTAERLAKRAERLEAALPGRGHVVERVDAWRRRTALTSTRLPLLHELVAVTVAELRRRAARRWPLPEGEQLEVALGRRAADEAVARWVGGGVSRLELGLDRGLTVCDLPRLLARETYPGRHAGRVLCDHWARSGAIAAERAAVVDLTPQAALLEGAATWAFDAVFPPAAAAAFAREELLPRAGSARPRSTSRPCSTRPRPWTRASSRRRPRRARRRRVRAGGGDLPRRLDAAAPVGDRGAHPGDAFAAPAAAAVRPRGRSRGAAGLRGA